MDKVGDEVARCDKMEKTGKKGLGTEKRTEEVTLVVNGADQRIPEESFKSVHFREVLGDDNVQGVWKMEDKQKEDLGM